MKLAPGCKELPHVPFDQTGAFSPQAMGREQVTSNCGESPAQNVLGRQRPTHPASSRAKRVGRSHPAPPTSDFCFQGPTSASDSALKRPKSRNHPGKEQHQTDWTVWGCRRWHQRSHRRKVARGRKLNSKEPSRGFCQHRCCLNPTLRGQEEFTRGTEN